MKDVLPGLLAASSLLLSFFTLWITQFRRGRLCMTQPTLLCLKRDLPIGEPKIFLRTLLYTTASKGRVVEAMFLRVHQPAGTYTFDFWGHTEGGKLTLGSGLFVGQPGVACDHHFNPRRGSDNFLFIAGKYRIEVFAVIAGKAKPIKLKEIQFDLDGQHAIELLQITDLELFLFWNSDTDSYEGCIERRPRSSDHTPLGL